MYRIGFDVGGTFTDFVGHNVENGLLYYFKVPSTPHDPSEAIAAGLTAFLEHTQASPDDVAFIGHGTTVATNMLLELRGVRAALITSRGFRDILELGRQTRPHLYDYAVRNPTPLIDRDLRLEIDERICASGGVVAAPDQDQLASVVDKAVAGGAEALAVCFLHSYRDPSHEKQVAAYIRERHPDLFVSTSSEVVPEFREYERFSATAANCYVGPKMRRYVEHLAKQLSQLGLSRQFYTIHSNGGLMPIQALLDFPVRTCLSGPAAGVVGAAVIASRTPYKDVVTFDVGGTSTDVSLIQGGVPSMSVDQSVAGYPLRVAMVDVEVIGAGGGSVAWMDDAGGLKMGPRSAGAVPGPVAYGLGATEPTLTDASLVLHRLDPTSPLGGKLNLDEVGAQAAISRAVAEPLGLSVEAAAAGMIAIATANMSRAIRSVSTEKGFDLGTFSLFAYGGAGPLYATAVARECGIGRIIVPVEPGTLCARGILLADISRDLVRTDDVVLDDASWPRLVDRFMAMEDEAHSWLDIENIAAANRAFEWVVDARYEGQNHEIRVALPRAPSKVSPAELITEFRARHSHEYGYDIDGRDVEIVNYRIKAIGRIDRPMSSGVLSSSSQPVATGSRLVYFGSEWVETTLYRRSDIGAGSVIPGPAIISEMSSTIVVDPDQRALCDEAGNLILEFC